MTDAEPADSNGGAPRAPAGSGWLARAKHAAATLKAEYEAGKHGDESPAATIWPTAKEQLDAVLKLLPSVRSAPARTSAELDADAAAVATALNGVDWASVRAATSERTSGARRAMRDMADQVDWAKAQPVAAQVSSALIAAVASGQLGVAGALGSTVARAIVDQSGLAQRVGRNLHEHQVSLPPDFRQVIDTTAKET
ncbi:unannotated protein [freshwater metagenome]|uniref:Unannotated protein n=1 Tax=freshwater metagenome TaxID=449393 RepID=A0A6J7F419_9ZZZZ|nr:hypothetical protein [Actinomycetota bacterium]